MLRSLRNNISTLLAVALLAWAGLSQMSLPKPEQFDAYHARAARAVAEIPTVMGWWHATERQADRAALELLQPNAIRSLELTDYRPQAISSPLRVFFTVVQCRRVTDMLGHFPPRCYPAYGDIEQHAMIRSWHIDDLHIQGTEYQFERVASGIVRTRIVYNFMIVPQRGIVPDMRALEEAADDYQQRHFGAAQFQVVFDAPSGQHPDATKRDEIFAQVIRSSAPALRVLLDQEP